MIRHKVLQTKRIAKFVMKTVPDYERILREANLMKQLRHPGIPLIYDIEECKDSICIIEEYISGKSLTKYLVDHPKLQDKQIAQIGIKICNILEYLHEFDNIGVAHLDLKPDNIIIDEHNEVRFIDFDSSAHNGELILNSYGSVGFAAPEQYHRLFCDRRADIYSVGMLLLYMVNHSCIQSNADHLHQSKFYPIIKKCTRHSLIQRYSHISSVRSALETVIKIKQQPVSEKSQTIYVYGSKSGVGTTHLCLCISSFLSRHYGQVLCEEQADRRDFISEARKGVLKENGTYYLNGVYLLPKYNSSIVCDLKGYHITVKDCGVFHQRRNSQKRVEERALNSNSIQVMVVNYGYRMKQEVQAVRQAHPEMLIFVNHISGKKFCEFVNEVQISNRIFRVPCHYEWQEVSGVMDEMLSDAFEEFLGIRSVSHKNTYSAKLLKNSIGGMIRMIGSNMGGMGRIIDGTVRKSKFISGKEREIHTKEKKKS